MRAKKCVSILVAASLATTMLTACPWEKEEDKTDDASSVPVTSTDTSQDYDDSTPSEKPSLTITNNGSTITAGGNAVTITTANGSYALTLNQSGDTLTITPTPDEKHTTTAVTAEVTSTSQGNLKTSWTRDTATRARTLSMRTDTQLSLTTNDEGKTFTLTGIPADATSCTIDVTFADLGYVIEGSTYKVHSAKGLLAWAQSKDVLTTDCTLTDDITFDSNTNWTPIGNYNDSNGYTGTFDGDGHTISGLHVSNTGNYIGLFGYVNGGTVKNLNLEITSVSGNDFVGGVVGYNYNGIIQGCMVSGRVSGSRYVGGVVGYNNETVEGCCFAGSGSSVTGSASSAWVGGVVGANNGTVEGCCFAGGSVSDTGDGAYVGGVVGRNWGTVKGCCFAGGSVNGSGTYAYVGGVVGYNPGTITGCYWQEGTGDSPNKGVGNDSGEENCKKVDGTNVTLTTAISTMNDCIRGTGYKYEQQGENIVLVADGSSTPEVSGLTQRVLDTARMFGM